MIRFCPKCSTHIDLRDLPMPLYDGDLEASEGIPPNGRKLKDLMLSHDAFLIASPEYARTHGLRPRARVRSLATAGAEPVIMLTAPTPASRKALHKAGMGVQDIDLWEINEAFAVVPLKTMRDMEIAPEKVNVNGGAIALGHPIGATGAMLLGTVLLSPTAKNGIKS